MDLINASIVFRVGMPSYLGTLATSFSIAGLLTYLMNGRFIYREGRIPLLEKFLHPSPLLHRRRPHHQDGTAAAVLPEWAVSEREIRFPGLPARAYRAS